MLNFGPYYTDEFPGLRVSPTLVDRVLEGIAILLAIAGWVCATWVYLHVADKDVAKSSFLFAGLATFCMLVIGVCAYLPARFVKFPVRITKNNVATQFFLAVRTSRVLNIFIVLLFLTLVFKRVEVECGIPQGTCNLLTIIITSLLLLTLIVYYVFAFKFK